MLTMRLQHHQGCLETPKYAYVIYGQSLRIKNLQEFTKSSTWLSDTSINFLLNIMSFESQNENIGLIHTDFFHRIVRLGEF